MKLYQMTISGALFWLFLIFGGEAYYKTFPMAFFVDAPKNMYQMAVPRTLFFLVAFFCEGIIEDIPDEAFLRKYKKVAPEDIFETLFEEI